MYAPRRRASSYERRTHKRVIVDLLAVVRLPNGEALPCRVKNISPMGALIELSNIISVPRAFRLTIPDALFSAECEFRHQEGGMVGLLFTTGRMEALARFG